MTPEQAEKHKDVIKWWLDNTDKGVWVRLENPKEWRISKHPSWDITLPYVQNDEYAELRKAQANGKVIQYNHTTNQWNDIPDLDKALEYCKRPEMYRIKPSEPEFKVGDWVVHKDTLLSDRPFKLTKENFDECLQYELKLWQPQEGDVVVCWTEDFSAFIREVIIIPDDDDMTLAVGLDEGYALISQLEHCIPYVGQPFEEMK